MGFSRYVIAWQISNTLDGPFCLAALGQARASGKSEILIHQGSQFTGHAFTTCLQEADVCIGMDGRGPVVDNTVVERFWRTVKYEKVYLKGHATVSVLTAGFGSCFGHWDTERPHEGLGYRTPAEVPLIVKGHYGKLLFTSCWPVFGPVNGDKLRE